MKLRHYFFQHKYFVQCCQTRVAHCRNLHPLPHLCLPFLEMSNSNVIIQFSPAISYPDRIRSKLKFTIVVFFSVGWFKISLFSFDFCNYQTKVNTQCTCRDLLNLFTWQSNSLMLNTMMIGSWHCMILYMEIKD